MPDKPTFREGEEVWLARLDLPEKFTVCEDDGEEVYLDLKDDTVFPWSIVDRDGVHPTELAALLASRDMLAERLERVNNRIAELEKETGA